MTVFPPETFDHMALIASFGASCAQNATTALTTPGPGDTSQRAYLPTGYIARVKYICVRSDNFAGAGDTATVFLSEGGTSLAAQFGALVITDALTRVETGYISAPYDIDCISAAKFLTMSATLTAAAGTLIITAQVWGLVFRS